MIKLFENFTSGRKYDKKNDFSSYHYDLGKFKFMFDVDKLYLNNNEIQYVLEDKYNFLKKEDIEKGIKYNEMDGGLSLPTYDVRNPNCFQRKMMNIFAKSINAELLLSEESSDTWFSVDYNNKNNNFDKNKLSNLNLLDTSDKIYVEVRNFKIKAVMCLFEKKEDLENYRVVLNKLKTIYPLYYVKVLGKYHYKIYDDSKKTMTEVKTLDEWIAYYGSIGLG